MALNDRAMLISLTISQWGNRKLDHKATSKVDSDFNTSGRVGKYSKRLLPHAESLNDIYAKSANIRKVFYENTMPWSIDGVMILPSAHYLTFSQQLADLIKDWNLAVSVFLAEYSELLQRADEHLGQLYNVEDYPSLDEMRKKFSIDVQVMPVPEADFRCGLDQADKDALEAQLAQTLNDNAAKGTSVLWRRLYDRVSHIHERLSKPDAIFHSSMIDKTEELCDLVEVLNIENDANLSEAVQVIRDSLIMDPKLLRTDPALRTKVAKTAGEIVEAIKTCL